MKIYKIDSDTPICSGVTARGKIETEKGWISTWRDMNGKWHVSCYTCEPNPYIDEVDQQELEKCYNSNI